MVQRAGIVVAALFLLLSSGYAQNGRFEFSVSAGALFSKQTNAFGVQQTPTQSLGILLTAGMRLNAITSLEVSYGHTRNSQKYTASGLDYRIVSTMSEYAGALVFRPFHMEKIHPFLLAGGGVLGFYPGDTFVDDVPALLTYSRQNKPTFIYGGGFDYPVSPHLAVRLQYRGLLYSPPNFKLPPLLTSGPGHIAEPSVGVVVKF